jgi:hypothetical protein
MGEFDDNKDLAEVETEFNRLAASLVNRPEDEIREALTRFWADNFDSLDENVTDWIEDDTSALANGEVVDLDVKRLS